MSSVLAVCDAAVARSTPHGAAIPRCHLALTATIATSALVFVDGAAISIALPSIGTSLELDASGLQWVLNAYLLPLAAFSLLGGAVADRFGRQRALAGGTAIFLLASLLCGLAHGLAMLVAARLLQGIGAAILMPSSLALLGQLFSGEKKGVAIGLWSAMAAVASAIAPALAGWLLDLGSWREVFFLNVPLAAAALWLTIAHVPDDVPAVGKKLDLMGGALAAGALACLIWALTEGGKGERTQVLEAAVAGVILAAVFVELEGRRRNWAMLPLGLMRSTAFVGITLFTMFLYTALSAILILMPFVLIRAAGYSSLEAGLIFVPLQIVMTIISPLVGGVASKVKARVPLIVGSLLIAAGFGLAVRVDVGSSYWASVFPAVLLVALGFAAAAAPLTTLVLTSVDELHSGAASGVNSAVTRLAGLVAATLIGSVLSRQGASLLEAFRVAMAIGAIACIGAAASALLIDHDRSKA